MSDDLTGTSLADYGKTTYERYNFTCVYCGFDGRSFDGWMQLSIDHVRPKSCGGTDDLDNLVVACRARNSITSRVKCEDDDTREDIIKKKLDRVDERRKKFYKNWIKNVAPRYLDRPLPETERESP